MTERQDKLSVVATPLEKRVLAWVKDNPYFTHKDLKNAFPMEHWRKLYRAMEILEKDHMIRFTGSYDKRQRIFTATDISELPTVLDNKNEGIVISQYVKHLEHLYKSNQLVWTRLLDLNEFPITILRMFLVPQMEGKEQRQLYYQTITELAQYRDLLTSMIESVDRVMKHSTMSGDLDHFLAIFNGDDKELPSPEDITNAKLWFSKNWGRVND